MASNVLDYFRSFGGAYAGLDDDALTQHIGTEHPEFLDVPEFRQDFDAMPQRLALKAELKRNLSNPEVTPFQVAMADALKTGMPGISPDEAKEYDAGDITPNYDPAGSGHPIGLQILAQQRDTDMAARKVNKPLTGSPFEGPADIVGDVVNRVGEVGGNLAEQFVRGQQISSALTTPWGSGGYTHISPNEGDTVTEMAHGAGKVLLPMALAAPVAGVVEGAALTAGLPSALSYLAGASAFAAPAAAQAYHDTGGDLSATAESGLAALALPAIDSIGRQLVAKGVSSVIVGGNKLVLESFERAPGIVTAEIRKSYPGLLDNETIQKALEFGGGQLLANAFLLAHDAPEIAASEHPTEELLKRTAVNVAMALTTSMSHGESLSKGDIRSIYAKRSEGGKFPFPVETVFHRDTSEKAITSDIPEMRARAEHAVKLDDLENSLKAAQVQGDKAAAAASKLLPGTTTGSNEQPGSEMPVRAEAQAEPQEAPSPRASGVTSDQGLNEVVPAEGETPVDSAVRLRRGQVTASAAGRLGGLAERRGEQVPAAPKGEAPDQLSPSSDLMARLKAARAGDEEQERQRLRQIAKGAPSLAEETDAPVKAQGQPISEKLGLDFGDDQAAGKALTTQINTLKRLIGENAAAPKVESAMEAMLQGAELSPSQQGILKRFGEQRKAVRSEPEFRKQAKEMIAKLEADLSKTAVKTQAKAPALATVAELVGELDEDGNAKPYEDWEKTPHEIAQALLAGSTNEKGGVGRSTRRFIIFHDPSNTDLPYVALPVYGTTSGAEKLGVSRKAQTFVPGTKASVGLAKFIESNSGLEPVYAIRLNKGSEQVLPESKGRLTQDQMDELVSDADARAKRVGQNEETAIASADFEQSGGSVRDEAVRVRDTEAKQSVAKSGYEGDATTEAHDFSRGFFERNKIEDNIREWLSENPDEDQSGATWAADNAVNIRKWANQFKADVNKRFGVEPTRRQIERFALDVMRLADELIDSENTSGERGNGRTGGGQDATKDGASGGRDPRATAAPDAGGTRVPGATQAASAPVSGEAPSDVKFSLDRGSVTKLDADYLAAVNRGDTEAAQRMVDEAAKASGFKVKAWRGGLIGNTPDFSRSRPGNVRPGTIFFTNKRGEALSYASGDKSQLVEAWLKPDEVWDLMEDGVGSIHYLVSSPASIKSADSVTRDTAGNVIPLSQRFDLNNPDIRFSLGASGQTPYVPSNPVEPLTAGSSITESDVKAIQSLVELVGATGNEHIAHNIQPSRVNLNDPAEQQRLGLTPELKAALETVFGVRVVLVNQPEGPLFKGVHTFGNVFISDHVNNAALEVFGHELSHELKANDHELFKKLEKAIAAGLKAGEFQSMMGDVQRSSDAAGVTGTDLDDEVIGDVLGEAFKDPDLFKKLAEKDPSLFGKLAKFAMDLLSRVINYFRQQGPSLRSRAKDYEKLQDHIVEILRAYSGKRTGSILKERYASRDSYITEQRDPVTGAVAIPRGTQGGASGAGGEGLATAETVSRNREVQSRAVEVVRRVLATESRSAGSTWDKVVAEHGVHHASSEAIRKTLTLPIESITDPELRAAVEGFREFVPLWHEAKAKEFFEHPLSSLINLWDKQIVDAANESDAGGVEFKGKPFADELRSLLQTSGAFKHLNDPYAATNLKDITNWLDDLSNTDSPMLGAIIADSILQHPGYKKAFTARGERLGGGSEAEAFKVGDQVYKIVRLSLSLGDLSKKVGFNDDNDTLQFFDSGGVALPIAQRALDSSMLPGVTPTQVVALLTDGKFIVRQPIAGDPMNNLDAMEKRKLDMTPKGRDQMFRKWADENGYKRVHVPNERDSDVFNNMYFTRLPDGSVVALADVNERNVAVGPDGKLNVYDPIIHRLGTNEALKPMSSLVDAGGGTYIKAKLPAPDALAPRLPITEPSSKPFNLKRTVGKQSFSFSLDRLSEVGPGAVSDATEVARMGREQVESLKSGAAALDEMAYNRKQYRQAVLLLNKLWEKAKDEAIIRDIKPEKVAGPTDDKFLDTLQALGVSHNRDTTQAMQEAVKFERMAATHNRLSGRARTLDSLIEMLTEMGGYDAVIAEHEEALEKVHAKLEKLGDREHNGQAVASRSGEMWLAEQAKPEAEAKRRALSIPEVHDNFVGPMAAFNALLEEFPDLAHADWTTKLGMPENDGLTNRLFIAVNSVLKRFDHAKAALKDRRAVEEASKRGPLNELLSGARDSSMAGSYAELVLADAERAMAGEQGLTGDVVSAQHVQWIKENGSAVTRFATRLAEVVEAAPDPAIGTPSANAAHEAGKRILEWLREPTGDAPLLPMQGHSGEFGVSDPTLDTIFKLVASHDTFREAVATLVDDAREDIPMDRLAEIATAASAGKKKESKALFKTLVKAKLSEQKRMTAQAASQMREAADIKADLDALAHGDSLFNSVAASPAFKQLRELSENGLFGYLKPMVVSAANENQPVNSNLTLKGFSVGESDTPAVVVATDSLRNPAFADKARAAVVRWAAEAESYVYGYESALSDYTSGISSLTPTDIGYDTPTYRGLKLALERDIPTLTDPSHEDGTSTLQPSSMMALWNTMGFVTQIDQVATNLGGVFGSWVKSKVSEYRDIHGDVVAVSMKPRFLGVDMPKLRSAALASHPEFAGNMDLYRERVQNPAGTIGRQFGSTLKVGTLLPSGVKVTAEDMAWFRRQLEYSRTILGRVQRRLDQATRVTTPVGEVLTRKAGSVGDFDFTRLVSQEGASASIDLAKLAEEPVIETSTDLTTASANPTVAFWNSRAERNDVLTWHVLDSQRDDLALKKDAVMRRAERALASDIEAGGYVQKFKSVGELVDALIAKFPTGTRLNPREHVVRELGQELKGYAGLARARVQPSGVEDTSTLAQVEAMNRESEFNKPAGLLELPSVFYDMGSLTDGDFSGMQVRAVTPAMLEMAKSFAQAQHELETRLATVSPDGRPGDASALPNGWTEGQLKLVLKSLQKLNSLLLRKQTPQSVPGRIARGSLRLIVGSLLMGPKVGMRNITQGQMPHYMLKSKLDGFGRSVALIRTLGSTASVIAKYLGRVAVSVPGFQQSLRYLKKHSPASMKTLIGFAESLYRRWVQDSIDTQRDLGFGQKSNVIEPIIRAWREAGEFENHKDAASYPMIPRKVRVGLRRAFNVAGGAFRGVESKVGLGGGPDPLLNTEVLPTYQALTDTLREAAIAHGRRIAAGGRPDALVVPKDLSGRRLVDDQRNHVADVREMLQMAGLPLEHALNDYYRRSEGGTRTDVPFFEDEQKRSMLRVLIGFVNAPTGTNRAQAIRSDRLMASVFSLRGYITDFTGKLIGNWRQVRGKSTSSKLAHAFANGLMAVLAAFLLGITSTEFTGEYERKLLRQVGKMVPSDADFWRPEGLATRSIAMASQNLGQFGDLILTALQWQQGGKGFDFAGKVVPVSLANDILKWVTGLYQLPSKDWDVIAKSVLRRFMPLVDDAASAFGKNPDRERMAGSMGFKESNKIANPQADQKPKGDFTWGPTTGIKLKLNDALFLAEKAKQGKDPVAYANAMAEARSQHDRLVDYYKKERGMNDVAANAAARRDFAAMNPATRANGGKVMTPVEYKNAVALLSGDRKEAWDTTLAAWQLGASMFPDQSGDDVDTSPARERKVAGTSSGSSRGGSVNLRRQPVIGGVAASASGVSRAASSTSQQASAATPAASVRLRRGGRVARGRSVSRLASRNRGGGPRVRVRRGGRGRRSVRRRPR